MDSSLALVATRLERWAELGTIPILVVGESCEPSQEKWRAIGRAKYCSRFPAGGLVRYRWQVSYTAAATLEKAWDALGWCVCAESRRKRRECSSLV